MIVTDVGGIRESVADEVSGLIAPEVTPEAIVEQVLRFFDKQLEATLAPGVREAKKMYSWDALVEGIERLVATRNEDA